MTPALKQSMDALETIAFVLPGPWGPVASAALHMLGPLLEPSEPDPNKPVLDAVKNGFADLESFMTNKEIKASSKTIDTLKTWIEKTEAIADLSTNPSSLQRVIDSIADLDKPINDVDTVANALDVDIPTTLPEYLELSKAKISTLIALRVSLACILNFRVLLQQKLVNLLLASDEVSDQAAVLKAMRDLQYYFNDLKAFIEVNMTASAVISGIEQRCDAMARVATARIGPVQQDGSDPWWASPNAKVSYHYTDDSVPQQELDREYNEYHEHWDNTLASPQWDLSKDKRAEVTQLRADRIDRIQVECSAFKADSVNILTTAKSIMADTKGDPAPPAQKPGVDYDNDTGWNNAWQLAGKYVRYAVLFQGPTRNTLPSPFSDWHLCAAGSSYCPAVSLPTDSSGLAIARLVYRDVADDPSSKNVDTFVVPVPNMTDDTLVDLCPVDDGDVCPNAPVPPVLMYCNYNADEPKRTWPDPYRVRYRYSYRRTIAGKPCQSLSPSPWFVQTRNGGSDFDDNGYFYSEAYYSAQLLVPHVEGCDLILERQFKGESPMVIKSRTAPATQAGMIFLEDDEGP